MHRLLLVLRPLDLVIQPLVHSEGEDHSDHVAELPTPGVGFLAHSPARQILTESILDTRSSCHVSAHLVETTGSALQCGARTVVASPACGPTLETVADVLHVLGIVSHPDIILVIILITI